MPDSAVRDNRQPIAQGTQTALGGMGQYYLLEKIAQGGMAEIYKGLAYDLHGIKRTVVIKKILPQAAASKEFIDMLVAEAKIAVMLSHGNIAQIYDLGKAGSDYFIVMEYVEGRSVSQILKQCVATEQLPPVPVACYIIGEIAAGLDYMHRRTDERGHPLQIIHRDVSPQNVIVSYAGTVKIIDFGIAKARTQLETTDIGILKGKFAYMSPEQAEGNPIDSRSDTFSLGVIMHEMCTGKRLFKAAENRETLRNVRRAVVVPPSTLRADLPAGIDPIVCKALAKRPADRYPTAAAFRDDLIRFLYQQYPEFQPADVAAFLAALFDEERSNGAAREDEAKTPLLIIDQTQSAIAETVPSSARLSDAAPPIVSQFLLTMEEEKPPTVDRSERARDTSAGGGSAFGGTGATPPMDEVSYTPMLPTHRPRTPLPWQRVWQAFAGALAVSALAVTVFTGWQRFAPRHTEQTVANTTVPTPPLLPAVGRIAITSDPAGAQVFIDDRATSLTTPTTLDRLEPGRQYTIGLFLPRYTFWSTRMTPTGGTADALQVTMVVDYGTLEVLAVPDGAVVEINGARVGPAPVTRGELMPGEAATVRVTAEGFLPWERQVLVEPGKHVTVRARLRRKVSGP